TAAVEIFGQGVLILLEQGTGVEAIVVAGEHQYGLVALQRAKRGESVCCRIHRVETHAERSQHCFVSGSLVSESPELGPIVVDQEHLPGGGGRAATSPE